jgi:hypothetical protein
MNPFIALKAASNAGVEEQYYLNVNHIVRITRAGKGCKIWTTVGEFYSDETPDQIAALIKIALDGKS